MNQNIITYLNENKERYSKEALAAELEKSGYEKGDIAESIEQVFSGTVAVPTPAAKTSFWNFKDKKVYTKASEKWADFLFGVFAPTLFGFVAMLTFGFNLYLTPLVPPLLFLFWVVAMVYFFSRRRFIFYGMISSTIILPALFVLFISAMFRF